MAAGADVQRTATAEAVRQRLRGGGTDVRGTIFEGLLLLALVTAFAILVALLVDIAARGLPVFVERGFEFITSDGSSRASRAGVAQAILGSILLMLFVVAAAFPIGVAAAVYLEEYAHDNWFTRLINTVVRNLAGVPAIVYGLLGAFLFVNLFAGLGNNGRNVYAGGMTLAVLVLPIVIITTAEALRAVPASIREAAYGVGATRWEVIRSHVLPYAAPGVFTGTILALARAFGETAPLILVGAVIGNFSYSADSVTEQLGGPYTSLPTLIYDWARQPNVDFQANTAAAIMVLLVVLLTIQALAIYLRNRFERKW